jgi:hypothetical protein
MYYLFRGHKYLKDVFVHLLLLEVLIKIPLGFVLGIGKRLNCKPTGTGNCGS